MHRRTRTWLRATLWSVWERHFPDIAVANVVDITYCRPTKTRLGWIALSETGQSTLIGINRLLGHWEVPDDVCTVTIAHELVHYSHGFGSPLPRRYADPHADAVVERELGARGLGGALVTHEYWSQRHWPEFYARHAPSRQGPSARATSGKAAIAMDDERAVALEL